jgi:hypothetical protein
MNRVEKFKKWSESHKIISVLVIIGLIIVALGTVAESLDKFLGFVHRLKPIETPDTKIAQQAWLPPELPKNCENVYLLFGGNSSEMTPEEINKTAHYMIIGGFEPIKWAVKSNRFYVDVDIPLNDRIIKLRGGEISAQLPPKWDMNYNSNALEIVAGNGNPIYQVFYRRPDEIVVNGIFVHEGVAIIATTNGFEWYNLPPRQLVSDFYDGVRPLDFKPIFKYPAWQYRGELAK